jgi:hypothetical protein
MSNAPPVDICKKAINNLKTLKSRLMDGKPTLGKRRKERQMREIRKKRKFGWLSF